MRDEVKLIDPLSGCEVRIGRAELMQKCPKCGKQMVGAWVASTETSGWECLVHLQTTLMAHNVSDRGQAMIAAREQLRDKMPGDKVVATRQLLVAVGLS